MPQMTPAGARIVDPILTTVARGYQNASFVGMSLFPYVGVGTRAGKILSFGKESFQIYDTARAPGAGIKRINLGYAGESYALIDHALAAQVPVELMEEARAVPGIELASAAVRTVQDAMALRLEVEQAQIATNAAAYAAGNKATLAGTTQWSHADADPIAAIEAAKDAVRSKIGRRPNTLVLGPAVFAALKTHAKIIERLKYTQREIATPELLASLFGLQSVQIGEAVSSDSKGTFADVWGKSAVLAFTETASAADLGRPTYGYTYRLSNYPVVGQPRYDGDTRTWLYDVADACAPVIAGALAGYLFSAAVA